MQTAVVAARHGTNNEGVRVGIYSGRTVCILDGVGERVLPVTINILELSVHLLEIEPDVSVQLLLVEYVSAALHEIPSLLNFICAPTPIPLSQSSAFNANAGL